MRSAELIGEIFRQATLTLTFRIPHSEFRTCQPGNRNITLRRHLAGERRRA